MNRKSAAEIVNLGSILGPVKPNAVKIALATSLLDVQYYNLIERLLAPGSIPELAMEKTLYAYFPLESSSLPVVVAMQDLQTEP